MKVTLNFRILLCFLLTAITLLAFAQSVDAQLINWVKLNGEANVIVAPGASITVDINVSGR